MKQRELNTEIKRHQSDRESLGVNLYELQQELGRQQANLEDEHDKLAKERQHRRIIENELEGQIFIFQIFEKFILKPEIF